MALPWNRVKVLSLVLTIFGLFWFFVLTLPSELESLISDEKK